MNKFNSSYGYYKDIEKESFLGESGEGVIQSMSSNARQRFIQDQLGIPWQAQMGLETIPETFLEKKVNKGLSTGRAVASSLADFGVEWFTEEMFDGIKFKGTGKNTVNDILNKNINKIEDNIARTSLQYLKGVYGEGAEEVIGDYLSALSDYLIENVGEKEITLDELKQIVIDVTKDPQTLKDFISGAASVVGQDVYTGGANIRGQYRNEQRKQGIIESNLTQKEKQTLIDSMENETSEKPSEKELKKQEETKTKVNEILNKLGDEDRAVVQYALEQNDIAKTISESDLSNEDKNMLFTFAENQKSSLEEVKNAIEDIKNDNYDFINQKQGTTTQNETVLPQAQQTNQLPTKQAENETSSEITTNLMRSIDNYNNSRQEGEKIFDINDENTRKEIESIQKIAEKRGINITFDESRFDNTDTNAFYEYDEKGNVANIVLNPNSTSKKYVQNLVIHEMAHSFEGNKEYDSLSKAILDYAKSKGEYKNAFDDLMNTYSKVYSGENLDAIVEKEAVANILGEKLGDKEFVDSLVNNQYVERSTIQKIIDFVKNQINRFKGYKDQEAYWNHVKTLFEDAYNKSEVSQEGIKSSVERNKLTDTRDSQGRQLSEGQVEYFKDSKVRDENGNLLTVYHGTPNGEFTVFDKNKIGSVTDTEVENGDYGSGFYFTPVKEGAESYAIGEKGKVVEAYVNLKNPLRLDLLSKIDNDITQYMKDNKKNAFTMTDEEYQQIYDKYGMTEEQYEQATEILDDLNNNDYISTDIQSLGYDGVISPGMEQIVAFEPNQIKSIDNTNPTTNDDIRYSIEGDGKDYFYRGQEKEGKDLSYNSTGFMGLKDGGYYFTPNKETANKYGNNIIERYRNEENTVTVKESDELQKMATEKLNEHMKQGIWTEEDDLLEQMSLGRSKAFAEYTGKPFVETGDKFGEDAEAIYYPEFDKESNIKENTPTKDSQGKELSKGQQEFFKDVSPELKDENGNIKRFYHGTNNDFTIFDLTKGGQSNTGASVGFWFTETREGAENFANDVWYGDKKPNVKEVYLDMKNPKIYENVENAEQEEYYKNKSTELENKAKEIRKRYSWDKTDYKTQMTFDTLIMDYRYNKVDLELFEGLAEGRGFTKEQIAEMEKDAKEYDKTLKESKKAENEYYKLRYSDAYEQFKIDLYEVAGQSAEEANTGGLGMMLNNPKETVEKFRQKLIAEGYDGIIIKGTEFDRGSFNGNNNQYVIFNSNQAKNIDNINPTDNPDIRYSQDTTGAWNNFIEKYFKNEGTGTAIKDLKKLPTREYTIQDYEEVINNSANIPEADKTAILKDLEGIELNKQSLNDFKQYVEDLDNNYKEVAQEQEQQRFEKKNYKDEGRAELISNKRKEFNTNMEYDDSVVAELDEIIPRNRNGKRTVAEWKNMAKQLGQRIANLSPEQIEDIAVKSYYDLEPTKAITRYDNQSKTNVGYEQLYANDWVNEVYEGVRENRQFSVETENNEEIKLPPKKEEIKLPRPEPKENPQLKITPENEVITEEIKPKTRKEVRKMLLDKMDITADELAEGKDISSINYQMTDPVRVNEKVFGRELGKRINDATINQTKHNTAEKIRWQNKERNEIADLGIKARSKESAAVQKYGEKQWVDKEGNTLKYGDEELARDFKDVKTQEKIKHAAEVIRQKYDTYLDQINEVLTSLGYDEIPKRQDYMRHFQELGDIFSQTGVPFNLNDMSADVLPTDINGLTEFNKPGKNWFASAQKRYGNKTTYDAITGIDGYLEGAGNLIFHTQDIQNYRALSTLIRDTFGATKGFDNLDKLTEEQAQKRIDDIMNNKLSGYAAWLDEQANSLAGKKGAIDRGIERFFGRRIYSGLNTLKSQVGSNMTGFNIRSALTNFISVTQAASKTQKTAMVQGALDTIKNIFHKDNFINESDFLTSRFGSDMLSKKLWQKASNAGQIFMSGTDYFTANLIARSKYYEGLHKGMSKQEALDYSNDFASRVMGDRSQGATAEAFNSKTLGFLTQFQLETNNQWQYMIHDTKMDFGKEKSISNGMKAGATALFQMGQLAAYSYFFNELFEKVTGSRAAFDPVDIIKKLFGLDDEDEEKGFEERMQSAASELADALPLTSLFGSGGRLPISEALKPLGTAYDYITGGTNKYGNTTTLKDVKNDTLGSLGYIALPTGYGQLRKTVQGLGMYNNELPGSYTDSGNLRYTVDDNMKQKTQAALFGKWANEYAKDYIESGYKTIAQKQIQELKELGMNSTEYRAYRKGLAQYNKQADKINYINSLNLSDEQKTIMANNVLDSDKYKVDMSNYNDFDSFDEFKKYYQDLYKNKK